MALELLHGTLDMLVLKVILVNPTHGHGIAKCIRGITGNALVIEEGSLYPALRRLRQRGLVNATSGLSANNRRARFYSVTDAGRTHLEAQRLYWHEFVDAVSRVLEFQ